MLLIDVESSSLDADSGDLIEAAAAVWSLPHRTYSRVLDVVVRANGNDAEHINGIPPSLVIDPDPVETTSRADAAKMLRWMAKGCDYVVSHNAAFDSKWLPELGELPWICSCDQVWWPGRRQRHSLLDVALSLGVTVTHVHRALSDVLLLIRLFERVTELGHDVGAMLEAAARRTVTVAAILDYRENNLARALGFRFDAERKRWIKRLAPDELATVEFPFRVQELP